MWGPHFEHRGPCWAAGFSLMEWEPRKGAERRSPHLAELTAGLSGH